MIKKAWYSSIFSFSSKLSCCGRDTIFSRGMRGHVCLFVLFWMSSKSKCCGKNSLKQRRQRGTWANVLYRGNMNVFLFIFFFKLFASHCQLTFTSKHFHCCKASGLFKCVYSGVQYMCMLACSRTTDRQGETCLHKQGPDGSKGQQQRR